MDKNATVYADSGRSSESYKQTRARIRGIIYPHRLAFTKSKYSLHGVPKRAEASSRPRTNDIIGVEAFNPTSGLASKALFAGKEI